MTYKKDVPDHTTVDEQASKGFAQSERGLDMKSKTKAGKGFAQSERGLDMDAETDAGKGFAQSERGFHKVDKDFPSDE